VLFALSTALRLLKPNRFELPRTLISLLSLSVITTITWLVIVFYSVTEGLEHKWIDQLISFSGSVRLFPKDQYFQSYDYLLDTIDPQSDYEPTTLGTKSRHPTDFLQLLNPIQKDELDTSSLKRLFSEQQVDRVRISAKVFDLLKSAKPCEVLSCAVQTKASGLRLKKLHKASLTDQIDLENWLTTQGAQLIGFDQAHEKVQSLCIPVTAQDLQMLWLSLASDPDKDLIPPLNSYLENFQVKEAEFLTNLIPLFECSYSSKNELKPCEAYVKANDLEIASIDSSATLHLISTHLEDLKISSFQPQPIQVIKKYPTYLDTAGFSIKQVYAPFYSLEHHRWLVKVSIQSNHHLKPCEIKGLAPACLIKPLKVLSSASLYSKAIFDSAQTNLVDTSNVSLADQTSASVSSILSKPSSSWVGILAPQPLKTLGLHLGSLVYLQRPTVSPLGEFTHEAKGMITGFYDPGIFPLGARHLIAPFSLCERFHNGYEENPQANFWQMWPDSAIQWSQQLKDELHQLGYDQWFSCKNYEDYDSSQELLLQLRSDRMLLSLVASIILVVACSSIASMLVLLVNERRKDIAILRALGMSQQRLIQCFGLCGLLIGFISALLGTALAWVTLQNIDSFMAALSYLHGQPLLNASFYGSHLPNHMSLRALQIVWIGSAALSTLCGCLACWQAAKLSPSNLLKSL
jgi:lipoprotein-releasing system permease protein